MLAYLAQGVYFTLDAIYAVQEYGEGFHHLAGVPLWACIPEYTVRKPSAPHKRSSLLPECAIQSGALSAHSVLCVG